MNRNEITQLCERDVLDIAARLFGTSKDHLGRFDDYEGCANLVYQYERDGGNKGFYASPIVPTGPWN